MTWLLPSSLSSLATEGSTSDSTPPSEEVALWATSSGKPILRRSSWRGWKNRPWSRLLFGAVTSLTSTQLRSLIESIGSPAASRASRSAPPESDGDRTTSDGSGMTSSACFGRFDLESGVYLRTSLDLFGSDSDPSSETWPYSGSMSSGVVSARKEWAPPIDVSEFSSSPADGTAWTTPAADDTGTRTKKYAQGGTALSMQGANWPTPRANDDRATARQDYGLGRTMTDAVRNWPTPNANDADKASPGMKQDSVTMAARKWPTPRAITGGPESAKRKQELGRTESGGGDLQAASLTWPTPDANCWKGGTTGATRGTGRDGQLDDRSSLPGPPLSICGPECSPKHRRLNPAFVEWLMGLPPGWTTARIGFGPSATELSRYRRLLRSVSSRLAQDGG